MYQIKHFAPPHTVAHHTCPIAASSEWYMKQRFSIHLIFFINRLTLLWNKSRAVARIAMYFETLWRSIWKVLMRVRVELIQSRAFSIKIRLFVIHTKAFTQKIMENIAIESQSIRFVCKRFCLLIFNSTWHGKRMPNQVIFIFRCHLTKWFSSHLIRVCFNHRPWSKSFASSDC